MLFRILITIVVLVVVVVVVVLSRGWMVANGKPNRPARAVAVAADSTSLARGEHLALVVCAACHTADGTLPLAGGKENFLAIPGGPTFGVLVAPNLTPGGRLGLYSDAELARAIREGINHEGRAMLVMPSEQFTSLSDRDVAALIALLRSQPPVTLTVPQRSLNLLGLCVLGVGMFPNSVQPAVTQVV